MIVATLLLLGQTANLDNTIVPGNRIGPTVIGRTVDRVGAGKPTRFRGSDMAGNWNTWISGKSRLDVWSEELGEEMADTIRVVRTTAPGFALANGLRVGVSDARMRRAFPRAKSLGFYRPTWNPNVRVQVLDDAKGGLAFDVVRGKCVAIAVHRRGSSLLDGSCDYLGQQERPVYGD